MHISYNKLSKKLKKSGTEILVRKAVFKLWIKTVNILINNSK